MRERERERERDQFCIIQISPISLLKVESDDHTNHAVHNISLWEQFVRE